MRFNALRLAAACCALLCVFAMLGCSNGPTPDLAPHITPSGEIKPVRPIYSRASAELSPFSGEPEGAEYRARVNELYAIVVYDGLQPVFSENDPVAEIYSAALNILDTYLPNSWQTDEGGEYNTVHVIHDYLAGCVAYDFELYDRYRAGETDLGDDPAFHIDGALVGKTAVCDGLSRAFDFLCAIEGIKSVRVTGSLASSPHAWNKVRVGGVWYNIDVTADAAHYSVGGSGRHKQVSHGYFLLSDKAFAEFSAQPHVFGDTPFTANVDTDYYADKTTVIGDKEFSLTVTSREQLSELFSAVKSSGKTVGKLEVKLNYGGRVHVDYADMYRTDLEAEYAALGNADFGFNGNSVPYFRYPNGVYLLLFYY